MLRLITVWPFAEKQIKALAKQVKGIVTVEINLGQVHLEVERVIAGQVPVRLVGHPGGTLISPDQVIHTLKQEFGA